MKQDIWNSLGNKKRGEAQNMFNILDSLISVLHTLGILSLSFMR